MADDIKLQCANINSGTAVSLKGATATFSFKPLTRTSPITNGFRLSESQISGFENPKIVITGSIDTNDTNSNLITQKLLLDFAKNKYVGDTSSAIYLTINSGEQPVYMVGTESTTVETTAQTIKVIVDSFTVTASSETSKYSHLWAYTLNLVETA